MIYTRFTQGARLGNILFQVAVGASLAHRYGDEFRYIYPDNKRKDIDPYLDNFLREVKFVDQEPPGVEIYREPEFAYREIPYRDGLCLEGYFQSARYFDEPLIRRLFSAPPEIEHRLREHFPVLAHPHVCSISVRRGDYLKLPAFHPCYGWRFYERAMALMPADAVFIVCSDDFVWCRKMFRGDRFVFAEGASAADQLYLQSLCRHNITSNTSFGWWGAWLNPNPDKIVVYPRHWFGIRYRKLDTRDLTPASWVGLDVMPGLGNRIAGVGQSIYLSLLAWWKWVKRKLFGLR